MPKYLTKVVSTDESPRELKSNRESHRIAECGGLVTCFNSTCELSRDVRFHRWTRSLPLAAPRPPRTTWSAGERRPWPRLHRRGSNHW